MFIAPTPNITIWESYIVIADIGQESTSIVHEVKHLVRGDACIMGKAIPVS